MPGVWMGSGALSKQRLHGCSKRALSKQRNVAFSKVDLLRFSLRIHNVSLSIFAWLNHGMFLMVSTRLTATVRERTGHLLTLADSYAQFPIVFR